MKFKRVDKGIPALHREVGNAGYDLFARKGRTLLPGDTSMVPLNVVTEIPVGAVGFLFQRSSTYRKWGVRLTNNVGVIDSIFKGDGDEWSAEFKNETPYTVEIKRGEQSMPSSVSSSPTHGFN